MTSPAEDRTQAAPVCYRHPSRPTNVRCQNCEKPICADCMRDTPVGFRCPDCAGKSRQIFREDLIVTKVLLAVCWIVYLIQVGTGVADGGGANAAMSVGGELFQQGALQANIVAFNGDWWRPITSGFLHAGLLHIALNSWFIYSFGQLLEPALGRVKFALVYFIGMLGGAAGALLLSDPGTATVGASGAGFGLLGAALVMAQIRRNQAMAQQLMILAALNFAFTFAASGISVGGHVGGFLAGALCGWLAYGPLLRQQKLLVGVYVGLVVVLYAAALIIARQVAVLPTFG